MFLVCPATVKFGAFRQFWPTYPQPPSTRKRHPEELDQAVRGVAIGREKGVAVPSDLTLKSIRSRHASPTRLGSSEHPAGFGRNQWLDSIGIAG